MMLLTTRLQPDTFSRKGRRDLSMLALMYDCAAQVQEGDN